MLEPVIERVSAEDEETPYSGSHQHTHYTISEGVHGGVQASVDDGEHVKQEHPCYDEVCLLGNYHFRETLQHDLRSILH